MSTIDVIVTCHDYGRFLGEAIDSVLAQTCRDFELVVVDDGSTDLETIEVLDRLERSDIRLLRQENRGPSAARNAGIRQGGGEYVVCLDADDRLHPEFLEKTRRPLDADESGEIGFVAPWLQKFGEEEDVWRPRRFDPVLIGYLCCVPVTSLFRRRAWEDVGGYLEDLDLAEDWNFWIGMVGAGYRWEVVDEVLFHYRKHGRSKSDLSRVHRQRVFERVVAANPRYYARFHREILAALYARFRALDDVWHEKAVALEENEVLAAQLHEAQEELEEVRTAARRLEDAYRALEIDRRLLAEELDLRRLALEDLRRHHESSLAIDVDQLWQDREELRRNFETLEAEYRQLEEYVEDLRAATEERMSSATEPGG